MHPWYRTCLRPLLFTQDSESIHNRSLAALGAVSRSAILCECLERFFGAPALPVSLWNLAFPNPVGLAAGMDKQAEAVPSWEALGFGFVELGGVTAHPQPGNPAPRMFRCPPEEALINRMGFNNPGAAAIAKRLRQWRSLNRWPRHPVGINLGKSKITPLTEAAEDYRQSFLLLRDLADFFVINVSSPNTPGLRQLQDKSALDEILAAVQEANPVGRPILVKVAPDLSFAAMDDILELLETRHVAGLVATNTTLQRPDTTDPARLRVLREEGGLSGRPLARRSTEVIRHLYRQTRGTIPIIGVGGIFNAWDAWEKISAGASLVQIYTGFVYEGPSLPSTIVRGLQTMLEREGFGSPTEAVGFGCERGMGRKFPSIP